MVKRSSPRPTRLQPGFFVAVVLSVTGTGAVLLGCGHPATQVECDEIFNRSAEIELRLQNVTDPKVIAERTAAVRTAKGDELIQRCVGKRITDDAMTCVRKATTAEQMDQCLQ
jgi:hypothetical protein